jgi:hypothetical protein
MPSSGLWEQAQPGGRSAADMQRAEAGRAEASVRREGVGSPEHVGHTDLAGVGVSLAAAEGNQPQ